MKYSVYTRSVEIKQDIEKVADFIKQTPNLPQWTNFFVKVGELVNGYYLVETKIGPAKTRIESEPLNPNGNQFFVISSQFEERSETARIELKPNEQGTTVTFQIELPIDLPQQKVQLMLDGLQSELCKLKDLLETPTRKLITTKY